MTIELDIDISDIKDAVECEHCGVVLSSNYVKHIKTEYGEKVKCPVCHKETQLYRDLDDN